MFVANHATYQLAQEAYTRRDFHTAGDMAVKCIDSAPIKPEQFANWLNPLKAIDHNNKGEWFNGWKASCEALNAQLTDAIIIYMKSCQIYLESSSQVGNPQTAIEIAKRFFSLYKDFEMEQKVNRVFTQLEFSKYNIIYTNPILATQVLNFDIKKHRDHVDEAADAMLNLFHAMKRAEELDEITIKLKSLTL